MSNLPIGAHRIPQRPTIERAATGEGPANFRGGDQLEFASPRNAQADVGKEVVAALRPLLVPGPHHPVCGMLIEEKHRGKKKHRSEPQVFASRSKWKEMKSPTDGEQRAFGVKVIEKAGGYGAEACLHMIRTTAVHQDGTTEKSENQGNVNIQAALLGFAGAYDRPILFVDTLFNSWEERIQQAAGAIKYHPFISKNCIRAAVHEAVINGVAVQAEGSELIGAFMLNKASYAVATYLQTQYAHAATVDECGGELKKVFKDIMSPTKT